MTNKVFSGHLFKAQTVMHGGLGHPMKAVGWRYDGEFTRNRPKERTNTHTRRHGCVVRHKARGVLQTVDTNELGRCLGQGRTISFRLAEQLPIVSPPSHAIHSSTKWQIFHRYPPTTGHGKLSVERCTQSTWKRACH